MLHIDNRIFVVFCKIWPILPKTDRFFQKWTHSVKTNLHILKSVWFYSKSDPFLHKTGLIFLKLVHSSTFWSISSKNGSILPKSDPYFEKQMCSPKNRSILPKGLILPKTNMFFQKLIHSLKITLCKNSRQWDCFNDSTNFKISHLHKHKTLETPVVGLGVWSMKFAELFKCIVSRQEYCVCHSSLGRVWRGWHSGRLRAPQPSARSQWP